MYRYHPFYPPVQRPCAPKYYHTPFINPYDRIFPLVETKTFMSSAGKTLSLMENAKIVLQKINTSKEFAHKLMDAAQQSKLSEVHKLIQSTGTKVQPVASFNPDGLRLVFDEKLGVIDCCHVIVIIRWRDM